MESLVVILILLWSVLERPQCKGEIYSLHSISSIFVEHRILYLLSPPPALTSTHLPTYPLTYVLDINPAFKVSNIHHILSPPIFPQQPCQVDWGEREGVAPSWLTCLRQVLIQLNMHRLHNKALPLFFPAVQYYITTWTVRDDDSVCAPFYV